MSYVQEILHRLHRENPGQPAFLQAAGEVLTSLEPVVAQQETLYRQQGLLERLTQPDRELGFRVSWVDDRGQTQVNRGWRVQFNNALGPYKGGLRFHPTVDLGVVKFLGFEQIFKNALTGLPLGGGKGGADFDPKGKSDREVMAFCQSFMTQLHRHIGPHRDVPAGDIGVGEREIGYLYGQYRRLSGCFAGALTGKGQDFGGSAVRREATGYGLVYLTKKMLEAAGHALEGKQVLVSGAGNVAYYAMEKLYQLGAVPVTCSDSKGWIHDPEGVDLELLRQVKQVRRECLESYAALRPGAVYTPGRGVWQVPGQVALPCATQNELDLADAQALVKNRCLAVAEGANMPVCQEAVGYLQSQGVLFAPGKAANAGGVAVSGLEMSQNAQGMYWSFDRVDALLDRIMEDIFEKISREARELGRPGDLVAGANVAAFRKVARAMMAQGVV